MSIIRSNIARQLLAEGGAPRTPFSRGGRDRDVQMSGVAPSTDYSSFGDDQEADVARMEAAMNINQPPGSLSDEDAKALSYVNFGRPTRTPDRFTFGFPDNFNPFPLVTAGLTGIDKFLGRVTNRDRYNLARRTEFLRREGLIGPGEEDEKYSDSFLLSPEGLDMLKGMGYTTIQDVINKGEGGDNEPIKKLRAPITEDKKEESKSKFDDILKFYGARFAKGGRTDVESQYGADTYGSYSYEDDGNRDDGGPPTVMGGGTEPPMLPGGRGIDVGALQKQGLTPDEIVAVYGDYYGIDTTPTVAGPLGSLGTAPGGLTGGLQGLGTAPGGLTGGLKGLSQPTNLTSPAIGQVQGTNLSELKQGAFDAGKAISQEGSLFDKALTGSYGAGAVEKEQSLRDRFGIGKADGGEVRQEYGLGSIVKKATRAVKKVAKSPLGKAALAFGAYKLAGSPKIFGENSIIGKLTADKAFKGILGASLAAGLFAKEEEEDEKLPTVSNTDPQMTRTLEFYGGPRRFVEDGGDIDEAPIEMASNIENDKILEDLFEKYLDMGLSPKDAAEKAKEEFDRMSKKQGIERTMAAMGGMMEQDEMLNLGGNEMDLRGGGFVPLGEYEKKDDVPARLSKNEFVFTADAVRAAGGGSVDKGADVMYKTMKTLENKVA